MKAKIRVGMPKFPSSLLLLITLMGALSCTGSFNFTYHDKPFFFIQLLTSSWLHCFTVLLNCLFADITDPWDIGPSAKSSCMGCRKQNITWSLEVGWFKLLSANGFLIIYLTGKSGREEPLEERGFLAV